MDDVFAHTITTGVTSRVSLASNGTESRYESCGGAVSADGSVVAFISGDTSLVPGDTNGESGVFVARVNRFSFVDDDESMFEAGIDRSLRLM